MLETVYLNGEYRGKAAAALHVSDLTILRGYGVFDYFRYADGKPRFLADHIARFRNSALALDLPLRETDEELRTIVQELIDRNGLAEGGIRFVLTGGYAEDGYTPGSPNLLGLPYAFSAPAEKWYKRGCTVYLHSYERQLPTVKTIDYIEGIRLQPVLHKLGAQYPLYVDRDKCIRESDRSNFLIVQDGVLITPKENILLGITRKHLLLAAGQAGIPIEERAVSTEAFLKADEAIICSSVKGAMPIRQALGGGTFPDRDFGSPGPVTRRLIAAWQDYLK